MLTGGLFGFFFGAYQSFNCLKTDGAKPVSVTTAEIINTTSERILHLLARLHGISATINMKPLGNARTGSIPNPLGFFEVHIPLRVYSPLGAAAVVNHVALPEVGSVPAWGISLQDPPHSVPRAGDQAGSSFLRPVRSLPSRKDLRLQMQGTQCTGLD